MTLYVYTCIYNIINITRHIVPSDTEVQSELNYYAMHMGIGCLYQSVCL